MSAAPAGRSFANSGIALVTGLMLLAETAVGATIVV